MLEAGTAYSPEWRRSPRWGSAVRARVWVVHRRVLANMAGALAILVAGAALAWWRVQASGPPPVMIDPGHGGVDGGASAGGLLEKSVTLDTARRLRRHLEAMGVPVRLTREGDEDLGGPLTPGRHRRDLAERVRRTHECGAALLVSLHANSSRNPRERGYLILYQKDEAASRELAQRLDRAVRPLGVRREPPVPRTNLYLLRNCRVPAVLVELGFLSNPEDRAQLMNPEHLERVAMALAFSIYEYYRERTGTR